MMMASLIAAAALNLGTAGMRHVTFDGIPPTAYRNDGDVLVAEVDKSASFLLVPFDAPRAVKRVSFGWQANGRPTIADAAAEKTKAGDDYPLRIGLIISGKAPTVPFFAPAWIKAIADGLKHPSDRMLYLVVGAKHPVGARWESPYSDSMELLAVASVPGKDGYETATATLPSPLSVVGLWIMADADQSGAKFTTKLRDLVLE
jgi:hypothetical protein